MLAEQRMRDDVLEIDSTKQMRQRRGDHDPRLSAVVLGRFDQAFLQQSRHQEVAQMIRLELLLQVVLGEHGTRFGARTGV